MVADHAILGSEIAEGILKNLEYEQEKIDKIKCCIITHRFRTGNKQKTIVAKILFDSDKLDVMEEYFNRLKLEIEGIE